MLLNSISRYIIDWFSAFFGVSSLLITVKVFILDQIPNLANAPIQSSSTVALGVYLSLMLGVLYKQSESMKNIEKSMKESLDVLNKTLTKDDEKHNAILKQNEIIADHLKSINEKEKEQIDLIKDSASGIRPKSDVDDAFDQMSGYRAPLRRKK